jgi:Holliday junction resolvase
MKLDLKREHQIYKLADGTRVPGVTTVLGELAKPALIDWSAGEERAGILGCIKRGEEVPDYYFYKTKRDRASDLGTIIHARIEAWHKGEELEPDNIPADLFVKSAFGFSRYLAWWAEGGFKLVGSERQLVSEDLRCGGTVDVLAMAEAGLTLVDIKSTKASKWWPYPETLAQVATYAEMVGEVKRVIVVRVGKEEGDELQTYELNLTERAAGLRLFRAAKEAYLAKKELAR